LYARPCDKAEEKQTLLREQTLLGKLPVCLTDRQTGIAPGDSIIGGVVQAEEDRKPHNISGLF
jgi:hypothetical protein